MCHLKQHEEALRWSVQCEPFPCTRIMLSVITSCPSVTQSLQPSQWCRGARGQEVLMLAMALRYNHDICNWVWQREATKFFKEKDKSSRLGKTKTTKLYAEAARSYGQGGRTGVTLKRRKKKAISFAIGGTTARVLLRVCIHLVEQEKHSAGTCVY